MQKKGFQIQFYWTTFELSEKYERCPTSQISVLYVELKLILWIPKRTNSSICRFAMTAVKPTGKKVRLKTTWREWLKVLFVDVFNKKKVKRITKICYLLYRSAY